jgi:signal transduction histidine kinase
MLDKFINSNRDAIIAEARVRLGARTTLRPTDTELMTGIPMFLDQLGDAVRLARAGSPPDAVALGDCARQHGGELRQRGLTIGQAVRDYGDIGEAITKLTLERGAPMSGDEVLVLSRCVDEAIVSAVTEYARQREHAIQSEATERLGFLAHELRGVLATATLAYGALQGGTVGTGGSAGHLVARSLRRLAGLIERSLADVRLDAGIASVEPFSVEGFLEEIALGAAVHAQARGIDFTVPPVAGNVTIDGDRVILSAAVSNLLENAFKFTPRGGSVWLRTRVTTDRVLFDVEDECGGLPQGKLEELFAPFSQRGRDRSGIGLGLCICLKAARANRGEISVCDLPGTGCIFTLELPRSPASPLSIVDGEKGRSQGEGGPGPVKARAATRTWASRAQ